MPKRRLTQINVSGLAERKKEDGRIRPMLNATEKEVLRKRETIEKVVALYLDLDGNHSYDDICKETGLTRSKLSRLIKSEDFEEVYNSHFIEIGHDPRLRAGQAALVDMLPIALRELRDLLTSESTPATTRMRAIEKVIELNALKPQIGNTSEADELAKFLQNAQVNINLPAPAQYQKDLQAYEEGEWSEIAQNDTKGILSDGGN